MQDHPAVRVRTLAELHQTIAGCRMCPRMMPPPILWAREGQRALVIGQAPGITEPVRRPAVRGSRRAQARHLAGTARHHRATRSMLERFAFAAVAKCYPGRVPGGRGDRAPDRAERANCRPWTDALVRLLDPAVVVPGRAPRDRRLARARAADRGRREALRERRSRDRAAPPPLGRERLDERPRQPRARGRGGVTAARHDVLTSCHEDVTGAGPSFPCRGTRAGIGGDGGPLGTHRAALLIAAALLAPGLARDLARSLGDALPHAGRTSRLTPDERALRNPLLRALIDRALPRLVLERDVNGDDDEVPVWTSCRHARCARSRAGRAGAARARRACRRRPRRRALDVLPGLADQPSPAAPPCAATTTTTGRA